MHSCQRRTTKKSSLLFSRCSTCCCCFFIPLCSTRLFFCSRGKKSDLPSSLFFAFLASLRVLLLTDGGRQKQPRRQNVTYRGSFCSSRRLFSHSGKRLTRVIDPINYYKGKLFLRPLFILLYLEGSEQKRQYVYLYNTWPNETNSVCYISYE